MKYGSVFRTIVRVLQNALHCPKASLPAEVQHCLPKDIVQLPRDEVPYAYVLPAYGKALAEVQKQLKELQRRHNIELEG